MYSHVPHADLLLDSFAAFAAPAHPDTELYSQPFVVLDDLGSGLCGASDRQAAGGRTPNHSLRLNWLQSDSEAVEARAIVGVGLAARARPGPGPGPVG
jgi:hypothetical protein